MNISTESGHKGNKQVVVVASSSATGCDRIKAAIQGQGIFDVRSHIMADSGVIEIPPALANAADLLLLDIDQQSVHQLVDWSSKNSDQVLPVIVIGSSDDRVLMRAAMQAGARDYLTYPLASDEVVAAITQVMSHSQLQSQMDTDHGRLTAVINAKGGSGASVVACNLAHILASYMERDTAVIDMDLQFGALPLSFDVQTRDSLLDVIGTIDQLDPVALRGYMTRHQSGLDILGCMSEQLVMPWEVSAEDIRKLLTLAVNTYEHVIVDLPREIDPVSGLVLSSADRVMVVMQQSFAHLRDAKRMFELLRNYLGVPGKKLTLVVNRHTDRNPITVDDVRDAVHPAEVMFIPNDFVNVTDSLNVGVPLYQTAKNAPVTRSLCNIAERVDAGIGGGTENKSDPRDKGQRWSFPRMLGLSG